MNLQKLWYRLLMTVARGLVKIVDDSGPVQLAQVDLGPDQIVDRVWVMHDYGFSSNPPVDTEVVTNSIGGDRSKSFAVGASHRPTRPRNLQPGESIIYDALGRSIKLSTAGIVVEANGSPVTIIGASTIQATATTSITLTAPTINLIGNVNVTGTIIDLSGTNSVTLGALRTAYNAHQHPPSSNDNTDHPV